jgi:hypothetical protein
MRHVADRAQSLGPSFVTGPRPCEQQRRPTPARAWPGPTPPHPNCPHQVNILKSVAKPGDFVVFKLDIDNAAVEMPILRALTEDPAAVKLVDEFFFEHRGSTPFGLTWFTYFCRRVRTHTLQTCKRSVCSRRPQPQPPLPPPDVDFPPMRPYWGDTLDKNMGLAESMRLFLDIRKKGIRAHSWV